MATELAKAYVQIIPSAQGIQGSIASAMNGESGSAGQESGKTFAAGFGSVAKKALAAVGIGKIIADGIGGASEFETAMAKTSTLFTGTGEEFDALKGTILNLSSTYGLAATTLAEAAYSAESASVPMEQLGPMLEASAKLAQAGFTDIDTALSATAKTMNAYGDAAMSMEDIQKVLIQTQNLGITTVGELGASLANVTPTAAAMGVGFDQVGAAMAQLTASGVQTAQATTQLRSAMTELGKSGTKADSAFRAATEGTKYAGMGFKEAIAAGANLGDVFGMMQAYADKSGLSMVDLWGSVEAGNAAMLIASDVGTFSRNLGQMSTNADVVGEAYGKMSKTFGTSMNRLKESAKNFMTTLFQGGDISASFDTMLQSIGDVGEQLLPWLTNGLKTLGQNLPKLMGSLMDFGESILNALGNVDWIELGTTIIKGIIGALGSFGTRLTELIGNAITAVANGEVNFGEIGTAIWSGVTSVITEAGGWLQKLFDTAVSVVTDGSIDYGSIGSSILSGITGFLDNAGTFLSNLFKTGKDAVTNGTTIDWNEIGTAVLNGLTSAVDMAGHFLEGAFNAGAALVKAIDWNTLGTTIGNGVNSAVDLAGKFLEGCFTAGKALVEAIDWGNVGKTIGDGVNSTVDLAGKFLEGCFSAGKALVEAIDWGNVGKIIADGVNGTVDLAGKFLEGCFTAGKALVEAIPWSGIGTTIGDAIHTTIDTAGEFLETCFKGGLDLVKAIQWNDIGTSISGGVTGAIDAAGAFLKAPFDAGKRLITSIKWDEIGAAISGGVTKTIDASGDFLASSFTAAKDLIVGIPWSEVGAAISGGLGDVWGGLTGFLGGLLGGASEAVEGVGNMIGTSAEAVGELVRRLLGGDDAQKAADDLKQAMSDMEAALETGEENVKTLAKNIGSDIKSSIEENLKPADMQEIGSGVISNIQTGAESRESYLTGKLNSIGFKSSREFSAGGNWKSAGRAIIAGIVEGINETDWQLLLRMAVLGAAALDAVKSSLKIGSPSRVMRDEVGRWIPAGIVMGITDNAGLIDDAMNELAAETTGAGFNAALASQSSRFGSIAGNGFADSSEEGLFSRIVSAVREGLETAEIALYMDGEKVSRRFDEYLGDSLAAGRSL